MAQRFDRNFRLDAVDELRELKAFLNQNKIAAVFYTPTLPTEIVQALGEEYGERFTRVLTGALGSYYQLMYVPDISGSARNFSDHSHLNGTGYRTLSRDGLGQVPHHAGQYRRAARGIEGGLVEEKGGHSRSLRWLRPHATG